MAMFLAIVMVISVVPLKVFAAFPEETITDGGEPEASEPDSSIENSVTTDISDKVFVVGEATEFTVTTNVSEVSLYVFDKFKWVICSVVSVTLIHILTKTMLKYIVKKWNTH